jgi:hypothetical protein
MSHLRRSFTYANVVATCALMLALGGTAWAAVRVNGAQIVDRTITARDVKVGSLTGAEVRNGSLAAADLSAATRRALRGAAGPAGASGATGTPGAPGAAGAVGPAGLSFGLYDQGLSNGTITEHCVTHDAGAIDFTLTRPTRLFVSAEMRVLSNTGDGLDPNAGGYTHDVHLDTVPPASPIDYLTRSGATQDGQHVTSDITGLLPGNPILQPGAYRIENRVATTNATTGGSCDPPGAPINVDGSISVLGVGTGGA